MCEEASVSDGALQPAVRSRNSMFGASLEIICCSSAEKSECESQVPTRPSKSQDVRQWGSHIESDPAQRDQGVFDFYRLEASMKRHSFQQVRSAMQEHGSKEQP